MTWVFPLWLANVIGKATPSCCTKINLYAIRSDGIDFLVRPHDFFSLGFWVGVTLPFHSSWIYFLTHYVVVVGVNYSTVQYYQAFHTIVHEMIPEISVAILFSIFIHHVVQMNSWIHFTFMWQYVLCCRQSHSLQSSHRSDRVRSSQRDSARSLVANQSDTASEADTLTGVHLDNSSQFGIPPVFNARGNYKHLIVDSANSS